MKFDVLRSEYIDDVLKIENEAFSVPWSRTAFMGELDNPLAHYCLAVENGEVVAYGGFWHIIDEGHICNVAVRSDFRSHGIGRQLLKRMFSEARRLRIDRMTLEVRRSNSIAISLYESMGFICAGARKGYYPDGEDALIYWVDIRENQDVF